MRASRMLQPRQAPPHQARNDGRQHRSAPHRRMVAALAGRHLGVRTGELVVIDVDGAAGRQSLHALQARGTLPATRCATSARGLHLYFLADGHHVGSSIGRVAQGSTSAAVADTSSPRRAGTQTGRCTAGRRCPRSRDFAAGSPSSYRRPPNRPRAPPPGNRRRREQRASATLPAGGGGRRAARGRRCAGRHAQRHPQPGSISTRATRRRRARTPPATGQRSARGRPQRRARRARGTSDHRLRTPRRRTEPTIASPV